MGYGYPYLVENHIRVWPLSRKGKKMKKGSKKAYPSLRFDNQKMVIYFTENHTKIFCLNWWTTFWLWTLVRGSGIMPNIISLLEKHIALSTYVCHSFDLFLINKGGSSCIVLRSQRRKKGPHASLINMRSPNMYPCHFLSTWFIFSAWALEDEVYNFLPFLRSTSRIDCA